MATIVLGVAGSVAGGPVGAQAGALVGGIVDQLLFGSDVPEPKVPEARIQGFTYGQDIKQVLGTDLIAGTILWVKGNKIDVERRPRGSPSPLSKVAAPDDIHRVITCRVGICKAPAGGIGGILQIKVNGQAIYDVRGNPATGAPGIYRAQGVRFTLYRGLVSDEADPEEEADKGIGNSPAYRHWASVVFWRLPLGNSVAMPQVEFLVTTTPGSAAAGIEKTIHSANPQELIDWSYDPGSHMLWIGTCEQETCALVGYDLFTDELVANVAHTTLGIFTSSGSGGNAVTYVTGGPIVGGTVRPSVYLLQKGQVGHSNDNGQVHEIDRVAVRRKRAIPSGLQSHDHGRVRRVGDTDYLLLWSRGAVADPQLVVIDLDTGAVVGRYTHTAGKPIESADFQGGYIWSLQHEGDGVYLRRYNWRPDAATPTDGIQRASVRKLIKAGFTSPPDAMRYLEDLDHIIVLGGTGSTNLEFYDVGGNTPDSLDASGLQGHDYMLTQRQALESGVHDGAMWLLQDNGLFVDRIDLANRKVTETFGLSAVGLGAANNACHEPLGNSLIIRIGLKMHRVFLDRLSGVPMGLDKAIETIGAEAGLATSDFDLTGLAGLTLDGMTLNGQSPARGFIESLMTAFNLAAVESGDRIKFRRHDGGVDFTIAGEDLGAAENRGEDVPLRLTRLPDTDLPRRVEVTYRDVNENWEPLAQGETHPVFGGGRQTTLSLDIACSADFARRLAVATLYAAHSERERYRFSLPWDYLTAEPGDIVTIPHNGRTLTARITRVQTGAVLECEATEMVDVYDGVELGAAPNLPEPGITGIADSELFVLDIPFLRDSHAPFDEEGIYLGAAPRRDDLTWPGARVVRTSDGSDTGTTVALVGGGLAWGALMTPPADPAYPGWQAGGSMNIRMASGAPVSASLTDVLTQQRNLFLIACGDPFSTSGPGGWEIGQFVNATEQADGSFTLDTLLRGERGSDPYMAHAQGDRIIIGTAPEFERLAHAVAARFLYLCSSVGVRAILGDWNDREYLTSRGNSQKCWAPVNVLAERDSAGNVTLFWSRRPRIGGHMVDGIGVPQVEDTEVYEVDVYDGATVVRTINGGFTLGGSTDPWSAKVIYTAAQQTSDGLGPGDPVTVAVYQIGTVGRGFTVPVTV